MKSDQLFKLLTEMFGTNSLELEQVKALIAAGHTVTGGLFNFYVQVGEQRFEYTSPVMLAKFASQDHLVKDMISAKVSEVLHKATEFVSATSPALSLAGVTTTMPQSSAVATYHFGADPAPAAAQTELPTPVKSAPLANPAKPKPMLVDAVIKLSEARAVGQKVKGSNPGSIYRAVAIGPVNVAVRLQPNTISVRVEFQKERDESVVSKLVAMGFADHVSYLSMHLHLNGTPPSRVLGSILYGMEVEFDQISTTIGAING